MNPPGQAWRRPQPGAEGVSRINGGKDGAGEGKRSGVGGCLPKAQSIPSIQIRSESIREKIEMWKEKALIEKFVGVWPREKDVVHWIQST